MTAHIPESVSAWPVDATNMMPPRDPNDDDDEDVEENGGDESEGEEPQRARRIAAHDSARPPRAVADARPEGAAAAGDADPSAMAKLSDEARSASRRAIWTGALKRYSWPRVSRSVDWLGSHSRD
jgi:hypothetical protein